ncbi:hypothetical protein BH10PSE3_BH10PSE3_39040 [soil metagenome]
MAIALASYALANAETAADPLAARVDALRDRFVAAVKACGVAPAFEPSAEVLTTPSVIYYSYGKRSLLIGRWETLPPPIQGFMNQWAAHDMPGSTGQQLFDHLFNGFLVGHELGHWYDHQGGRQKTLDSYDEEIEANRFAIAFAALDPATAAERAKTVSQFSYLLTLPNPVPSGQDPRAWFNAHYETLSTSDPLAYNWYQGRFMQEAWTRRDEKNFCGLVKTTP